MRRLINKTTSVWKKEEGSVFLLPLVVAAIFVAPLLKEWLPVLAALNTTLILLLFIVGALVVARNVWRGSLPRGPSRLIASSEPSWPTFS